MWLKINNLQFLYTIMDEYKNLWSQWVITMAMKLLSEVYVNLFMESKLFI
jgi:hypothetical protein